MAPVTEPAHRVTTGDGRDERARHPGPAGQEGFMSALSGVWSTDAARARRSDKGLKAGALGLISSTVVGVASTAPAYSLAATLGFVVVAIGVRAPVVTILAFVPMLFISFGYKELNSADPDCGTTFTWATRAFSPRVGWMGGWGIIAADILVMASLAQIAGQYVFLLFGANGIGPTPAADGCSWSASCGSSP